MVSVESEICETRSGAQFFGKSSGITAEEDQFAQACIAVGAEPFGELRGGQLLSRGVEKNDGGMGVEFALAPGRRIAQFGDLDFGVMPDARNVIREKSARAGLPRFSQHHEMNFHGG